MNSEEKTALPTRIPNHIAIIMDGNGRWATSRGLPRSAGHHAGTENLRPLIKACVEFGVKYFTIYSFSTENWGRPEDEVHTLMSIMAEVIDNELPELDKEGVRILHIGRMDGVDPILQEKVQHALDTTQHNDRLILSIAFNYGGRDEIVHAIQRIIQDGVKPEDVNEKLVASYLFTAGTPNPDLIIRTSGEMRTSNFLIWQAAYSEWYVTPTYWPDFNREELLKAIVDYSKRDRRFGKLSGGNVQTGSGNQ